MNLPSILVEEPECVELPQGDHQAHDFLLIRSFLLNVFLENFEERKLLFRLKTCLLDSDHVVEHVADEDFALVHPVLDIWHLVILNCKDRVHLIVQEFQLGLEAILHNFLRPLQIVEDLLHEVIRNVEIGLLLLASAL